MRQVERRLNSRSVIDALYELFISRGIPEYIRSDNGSEFTATAVRKWLARMGVKTLFIEPGSPWENGYIESFNGKMRDELLDREAFSTLTEAKVLIEQWRREYNTIRPHSSLGYRPPAPEAVMAVITLFNKWYRFRGQVTMAFLLLDGLRSFPGLPQKVSPYQATNQPLIS